MVISIQVLAAKGVDYGGVLIGTLCVTFICTDQSTLSTIFLENIEKL